MLFFFATLFHCCLFFQMLGLLRAIAMFHARRSRCNLARLALQPCAPGFATVRTWRCNLARPLRRSPCNLAPLAVQPCAAPFATLRNEVGQRLGAVPHGLNRSRAHVDPGSGADDDGQDRQKAGPDLVRLRCCVCMACLSLDVPPGGIRILVWSLPSSP